MAQEHEELLRVALDSHSPTGEPALVGRVHATLVQSFDTYYATWRGVQDGGKGCVGADACIVLFWGSVANVGVTFVASGIYTHIHSIPWSLWILFALIWEIWVVVLAFSETDRQRQHRLLCSIQSQDPVTSTKPNERLPRVLDQPARAALVDLYANRILDAKLRFWLTAPAEALVARLYRALEHEAVWADYKPGEQERALALAVLDVCLYGETTAARC